MLKDTETEETKGFVITYHHFLSLMAFQLSGPGPMATLMLVALFALICILFLM